MGERRDVYWVLVGKPEKKGPLGRPRRRCENNIKMDLQEVEWWKWTGLIETSSGYGQIRVVLNAVMNFRVP